MLDLHDTGGAARDAGLDSEAEDALRRLETDLAPAAAAWPPARLRVRAVLTRYRESLQGGSAATAARAWTAFLEAVEDLRVLVRSGLPRRERDAAVRDALRVLDAIAHENADLRADSLRDGVAARVVTACARGR